MHRRYEHGALFRIRDSTGLSFRTPLRITPDHMPSGLWHDTCVPEMIEVELYRQTGVRALRREIAGVDAHDDWYLKEGTTPAALMELLVGSSFADARRQGKLMLLEVASKGAESFGSVLGLRFGMTGRLVVDGVAGIDELLYSTHRVDPSFVRFAVHFADGGTMQMVDPRRLGGVSIDPSMAKVGPDALSISVQSFSEMLRASSAPLKARLLDQQRVAGIGNLICDEVLWRARLSPARAANSLSVKEAKKLHSTMVDTICDLSERGGSHLGDLMGARSRGGRCPRCGKELQRTACGGRTSYWCSAEQR